VTWEVQNEWNGMECGMERGMKWNILKEEMAEKLIK